MEDQKQRPTFPWRVDSDSVETKAEEEDDEVEEEGLPTTNLRSVPGYRTWTGERQGVRSFCGCIVLISVRGRIQDGNSNTRNRSVKSVELATQTEEPKEQSVAWVFDTWVGTSLFVLPVPEEDSSCSCSGG